MSIFISVASYRDPQLLQTIKSAITNASDPASLKFGIVNQDTNRNTVDIDFECNYELILIHPRDAKGVGYARNIAMSMYNGEDYFLQVDSHTQFSKDWDLKCIEQLKLAQKVSGNDKVILSSYPPPYSLDGNEVFIHTKVVDEMEVEPTRQEVRLRTDDQWSAQRVLLDNPSSGIPELSKTVLGGFMFAPGILPSEVPYDKDISFLGEELCFAMRAWTRGWDIYSPAIPIVYHFYKRHGYSKIWNDNVVREKNWDQLQEVSQDKQRRVLCGIETGTYGAGSVRTLEEYEKFVGYDFKKVYERLTK